MSKSSPLNAIYFVFLIKGIGTYIGYWHYPDEKGGTDEKESKEMDLPAGDHLDGGYSNAAAGFCRNGITGEKRFRDRIG